VELAPQRMEDLIILLEPRFQIIIHLNVAVLAQGAKFFHGCFELDALKVEMAPQRVEDLIVPPGPRFQITKHLYLVVLAEGAKLFCGSLNLRF
jgi:hypothetical protein